MSSKGLFSVRTEGAFIPESCKVITASDTVPITTQGGQGGKCGLLAFNVTVAGDVELQMHRDAAAVVIALPVGYHQLVGHWKLWKSGNTTATATCTAFFAADTPT